MIDNDELEVFTIEDEEDEIVSFEDKVDDSKSKSDRVAKGKAITTKRGILSDGDEITSKDVGGDTAFKALVKAGHIVKA